MLWLVLLAALPGVLVAAVLLWIGDYSTQTRWTVTALMVGLWWGVAFALRERVVRPLQTLSNLLAGLREEDYSIRARGGRKDDALGEVHRELNALVETLKEQRLGALEAAALLRKVMAEIEVAVFTFDEAQQLRLVNRAGERLLAEPAERLLGRRADELGLAECFQGDSPRTLQTSFPGGAGRWGIRRSVFRQDGRPHQLLVLADLSRALREEERQAWQRLLRVLGHEMNNSLAPIRSLATTVAGLLRKEPKPEDWQDDVNRGLDIIATRAEALSRFMEAYTRVAKLPPPRLRPVDVSLLIDRVAGLETRLKVTVEPGPACVVSADGDQLEQLLINLVRNAVDAARETGGGVRVGWWVARQRLEVRVEDDGPGLSNTANLFVPFFTTKPKGSGIGLVLCQQIAEAHGGSVMLENRPDHRGCVARVRLPLS
ncbi:MAG: PAS domain-containing sensor histidine kinase [Verrucomicrobia bacterium]|nr:PAS domain-containing sensor histidine kinase [Verrucomicrobiota bacterium]